MTALDDDLGVVMMMPPAIVMTAVTLLDDDLLGVSRTAHDGHGDANRCNGAERDEKFTHCVASTCASECERQRQLQTIVPIGILNARSVPNWNSVFPHTTAGNWNSTVRLTLWGKDVIEEADMGKGILLWLLGIPIPIIILLLIFWH